jgi:hypothetical protein
VQGSVRRTHHAYARPRFVGKLVKFVVVYLNLTSSGSTMSDYTILILINDYQMDIFAHCAVSL